MTRSSSPSPCSTEPSLADEAPACAAHGAHAGYFDDALLTDARGFLVQPARAFRARLVEASFGAGGGLPSLPRSCLDVLELLHAASLLGDDFESDAELRRSAPALHGWLGTPAAMTVDDGLYGLALARLDELGLSQGEAGRVAQAARRALLRCHEGQALDLGLRAVELKRSELLAMAHTTSLLKTGALTGFAAGFGASVACAPVSVVQALTQFGEQLGVAICMADDLSAFVTPGRAHKALEDLRTHRVSWVWAWASEVNDEVTFKRLMRMAAHAEDLPRLRTRLAIEVGALGRTRVGDHLQCALRDLVQRLGADARVEGLARELELLTRSCG